MNSTIEEIFELRQIRPEEAPQAADMEQICFPPHEACPRDKMIKRVASVPDGFLCAVDRNTGLLAGLVNGIATDEEDFRDEFFTDEGIHDKNGKNIMICGVEVLPAYRGMGLARELISRFASLEKSKGRKALKLTCLKEKVKMYEKMGFVDLGISGSTWGNEIWYDMEMKL